MKPGTDPSEPAKGAILLEPGKKVSVHGVVTKPTRKERKDGPPLVEAELKVPADSFLAAARDAAAAQEFVIGAVSFEGLLLPEDDPEEDPAEPALPA